MGQLAHSHQRFQDAGVALLMVSVDSLRREQQLVDQTYPPFPVLSDADHDVAVAYNVFTNGIAIASTFLIDIEGRVRWGHIAENPADRPTIDQMLEQVARLGSERQEPA